MINLEVLDAISHKMTITDMRDTQTYYIVFNKIYICLALYLYKSSTDWDHVWK